MQVIRFWVVVVRYNLRALHQINKISLFQLLNLRFKNREKRLLFSIDYRGLMGDPVMLWCVVACDSEIVLRISLLVVISIPKNTVQVEPGLTHFATRCI